MDSIIANIVISISLLVLLATAGICAWSLYHSLRTNKRSKEENGIPVATIEIGVIAGTLAIALPTWCFASFTDMCLITAITLLATAGIAVVASKIIHRR